MAPPTDILYNRNALIKCGVNRDVADSLAKAICYIYNPNSEVIDTAFIKELEEKK